MSMAAYEQAGARSFARRSVGLLWLALPFALLVSCASSARYRAEIAPGVEIMRPPGPVLFVMTSADQQLLSDGSTRATGTFLGEFYEPYRALREARREIRGALPDALRERLVRGHERETMGRLEGEHPEYLLY